MSLVLNNRALFDFGTTKLIGKQQGINFLGKIMDSGTFLASLCKCKYP